MRARQETSFKQPKPFVTEGRRSVPRRDTAVGHGPPDAELAHTDRTAVPEGAQVPHSHGTQCSQDL